jgi:hypothetical protein
MLIGAEDSAQPLVSPGVQVGDLVGISEGRGLLAGRGWLALAARRTSTPNCSSSSPS